ncbi:hypothetical protein JHK85_049046 [Glycine max]|nr:hypothetical protein JHK85_049046 [Glycine max]
MDSSRRWDNAVCFSINDRRVPEVLDKVQIRDQIRFQGSGRFCTKVKFCLA